MCLEQLQAGILNERTFDARGDFSDVFDLLLRVAKLPDISGERSRREQQVKLVDGLQSKIHEKSKTLHALPRYEQYSRHLIGTHGEWMGFICRWEKNASSCVHGHPPFAFYQVIQGQFRMELYDAIDEHNAEFTHAETMQAGECIWRQGEVDRYDNLVHKVSSEQQDGFTLHLFSENPSRGWHYSAKKQTHVLPG